VTTKHIETHLMANTNMRKRDIVMANFLGGLAWGFGTVVGASVVVAIIASVFKGIGVFDFISSYFPQKFQ
jgi:hypothetical protein